MPVTFTFHKCRSSTKHSEAQFKSVSLCLMPCLCITNNINLLAASAAAYNRVFVAPSPTQRAVPMSLLARHRRTSPHRYRIADATIITTRPTPSNRRNAPTTKKLRVRLFPARALRKMINRRERVIVTYGPPAT